MRIKTLCAVAGSILFLPVLSGCGDPAPKERPDIATLRTTDPAAVAPPSAAVRERPVIRPDEGREEFDRYVAIFAQCLRDQGATVGTGAKPQIGSDAKSKAAAAACEHLYPENWMERERRVNPEFVDLLRVQAACLKGKGHDVTVGGDPVSIMYGDNTSANKAYDDEQECGRQAFRESIDTYDSAGG